ncbi:MAG TPA: hypothetical protein VGE30_02970 [Candidatus Saccharimonadales bacterium]
MTRPEQSNLHSLPSVTDEQLAARNAAQAEAYAATWAAEESAQDTEAETTFNPMIEIPRGVNYTLYRDPTSETQIAFFGTGQHIDALRQAHAEGRVAIPSSARIN